MDKGVNVMSLFSCLRKYKTLAFAFWMIVSSLLMVNCGGSDSKESEYPPGVYNCQATAVRVQVDMSSDPPTLIDAVLVVDEAPNSSGEIEVVNAEGEVIASAALPEPSSMRVYDPEGSSQSITASNIESVLIPWTGEAKAVKLGTVTIEKPICALAAGKADGIEAFSLHHCELDTNCFDIMILGDGFTASEQDKFNQVAQQASEDYLSVEPYKTYKHLISIWSYYAASNYSGAGRNNRPKDTAYKCTYGHGGVDRCLWCNEYLVVDTAQKAVPALDAILVIVNDEKHGGCGGDPQIAVAALTEEAKYTMIHELGHQGGLNDEYLYPPGESVSPIHPYLPNCSDSRTNTKWELWRNDPDVEPFVGAYLGCGTSQYYRPTFDSCVMRSHNTFGYCPVCREKIVKHVYDSTSGIIFLKNPEEYNPTLPAGAIEFSVQSGVPEETRLVKWLHNGVEIASGDLKHTFADCPQGIVKVQVEDTTPWVRKDTLGQTVESFTWTVNCEQGGGLTAGDIIITEIMANPISGSGDPQNEWFELHNTTWRTIDLYNFQVTDVEDSPARIHTIDEHFQLEPGAYVVLAHSTGDDIGFVPDILYGSTYITLANSGDLLVLLDPDGNEIDRIDYDDMDMPAVEAGVSMEAAKDRSYWCSSIGSVFNAAGEIGTPGFAGGCEANQLEKPKAGQLVISEILYNPSGSEYTDEWFEVVSMVDHSLDLQGLVISNTMDSFSISSALTLDAGQRLVFCQDDQQGPSNCVAYGKMYLSNSGRKITLTSENGTIIDEVEYDNGSPWPSSRNGVSIELSESSLDAESNDDGLNWCHATTPNIDNYCSPAESNSCQ
jgi:hypothetical protein